MTVLEAAAEHPPTGRLGEAETTVVMPAGIEHEQP